MLWITVFALLPLDTLGPFDARDYSTVEGVSLVYPMWAVFFEPILAPGQILAGSADFRLALVSNLTWVLIVSVIVSLLFGGLWYQRLLRACLVFTGTLVVFLSYVLFISINHLPSWKLVVHDTDMIAADLQSHTVGSHDGLVDVARSLRWYERRGYDLVAITEHDDPAGSFYAQQYAESVSSSVTVIPGVEVRSELGGWLLGLGLHSDINLPQRRGSDDFTREFIRAVQNLQHGAVISLSWRLRPEQVTELVDLGVDGFELVNMGHPDLSNDVRAAMLEQEQRGEIALVSSTDWHGWGGYARTWTLFRFPSARDSDHETRASKIITLLRDGRTEQIIPIVAGYIGPPSTAAVIFSPFVESARYASELDLLRLLSLWIWFAVAYLLVVYQAKRQRSATPWILSAWLLIVAIGLFLGGHGMLTGPTSDAVFLSSIVEDVAYTTLIFAVLSLILAMWMLRRGFVPLKSKQDDRAWN